MTTHDKGFADARSNIEPDDDADNAQEAHATVRSVLEADEYLTELDVGTVLVGSYGRHVSIKRIKDVDVFVRLPDADDSISHTALIDAIKGPLLKEFGSRVQEQDRSVKIDFPDFDLAVDAVPARPCVDHPNAHWQIPDAAHNWIETNPEKVTELTTGLNGKFKFGSGSQGAYVPTVKMVRQIRRASAIQRPSGFYFEILAYWAFQSDNIDQSSAAGYLTSCLTEMTTVLANAIDAGGLQDPTISGSIVTTRADAGELASALTRLQAAADLAKDALEDGDQCRSARKWRTLIGRDSLGDWVFPVPDNCNEDGSAKADLVPGESRSPRGTQRFA